MTDYTPSTDEQPDPYMAELIEALGSREEAESLIEVLMATGDASAWDGLRILEWFQPRLATPEHDRTVAAEALNAAAEEFEAGKTYPGSAVRLVLNSTALVWTSARLDRIERGDEPRCQYVSPTPWGAAQCALPAGHDDRHAYSPSERGDDD